MRSLLDQRGATIDETGAIGAWSAQCDWSCAAIDKTGVISTMLWSARPVQLALDRHGAIDEEWVELGDRTTMRERIEWLSSAWVSEWDACEWARWVSELRFKWADLSSFSLSISLFAHLTRKWFEVKIFTSNHFQGQRLILHGQLKIFFGKFIFHAQPNTSIYEKTFPEVIWSQNKRSLIYKKQNNKILKLQQKAPLLHLAYENLISVPNYIR